VQMQHRHIQSHKCLRRMPGIDVDNVCPSSFVSILFTGLSAIQLVRVLVQLHTNTTPLDVSRPSQKNSLYA